jgi:hypothetical protein
MLKDADAIEKLSSIDFLSTHKNSNLNTSIKNNYISAVTTCKIIIKSLKSI